jgi:hypothetical protein
VISIATFIGISQLQLQAALLPFCHHIPTEQAYKSLMGETRHVRYLREREEPISSDPARIGITG